MKERVDQKELMEVLGEVQRLQLMGCQILAQLGLWLVFLFLRERERERERD